MGLKKHAAVSVTAVEINELLAAANQAADVAAKITMSYFRKALLVDNKAGENAFDPVTQADKEAELAIRDILTTAFPSVGFYGEEHAAIESKSGLTWVVDPIDGTRAFMSGMPLWGTLIGLFDGENTVLGLMDIPFFEERFTAANGLSYLQNRHGRQALMTRKEVPLADATMYCTTPDMFESALSTKRFTSVKKAARLTRYGGDCYSYALLAAGHVDIVLDCDLQPYDITALIPVIEGAGGVVTNWDGNSAEDGGFVLASGSQAIHAQTLELLQSN
ncbi:MAG: histidinol phosphatase-like enzyme (inositol monophosphatase family) [Granulosicoccus sp.]|jgi:histidinol phosphatase-like enzyme (inositol monophosphatase family)